MSSPIIVIVDNHKYDITDFNHPGDSSTLSIKKFNGRDVTHKFIIAHHTSDPSDILASARKTGNCEGIKYLGIVEPSTINPPTSS